MIPIRVAVIGAGRWGRNLIRNIQQSQDYTLQAVYDINPESLKDLPGNVAFEVSELWKQRDFEAVMIATPPATHVQLVRECLLNDKHVLSEKPLGLSAAECQELLRLSQSRGLCLMVDCTPFYLDEIQAARASVPWHQVHTIQCVRTSKLVPICIEDLLWELAPHDLAILQGWLGDLTGRWTIHKPGLDSVILEGICPGKPRLMLEFGSSINPCREIKLIGPSPTIAFRQQQTVPEPLGVVIQRFAMCLRDGISPPTGAAGALATAQILEGACADLFAKNSASCLSQTAEVMP